MTKRYDVAILLECLDCFQEEIIYKVKSITLETEDGDYLWETFKIKYDLEVEDESNTNVR